MLSLILRIVAVLAVGTAGVVSAAPVIKNANFELTDVAQNATYNQGVFLIEDWRPVGYASNSLADPGQFDNGNAGGRSVVGFLSGPTSSLSQMVSGFTPGESYQIIVSAISRRASVLQALFQVLAGDLVVFGPQNLPQADPLGVFATPFTQIVSLPFTASAETVEIKFENAAGSDLNASTLLTGASVFANSAPPLNVVVNVAEPISFTLLGTALVALCCSRRGRTA